MENTPQETPKTPDELFAEWLGQFRYFVETSGYTDVLDEAAIRTNFYDAQIEAREAAISFLREKGI